MIQIFGTTKSFETKKARMWFKERGIPFQFIDLKEKAMSRGEFDSALSALIKSSGSKETAVAALADPAGKNYALLSYLDESDKAEKLFADQTLLRLPICRNGKNAATAGYVPEEWKDWR